MEVRAIARYVRMSPRKVRLVTNLIKGVRVDIARTQLNFLPKAAALVVLKLLNSAVANAVNNNHLDEKNLRIMSATTDGGPTLKRWRPRAMGRAAPIKKRTSHITIVLTEIVPSVPKEEKKAVKAEAITESKKENVEEIKSTKPSSAKSQEAKTSAKSKKSPAVKEGKALAKKLEDKS